MITENGDQTGLRTDGWYLNVRPIVAHNPLDLFKSLGQQPVELSGKYSGITGDDQLALSDFAYQQRCKSFWSEPTF